MTLREWIIQVCDVGDSTLWAVHSIDTEKRLIVRDSAFGPYPMTIPDDVEISEPLVMNNAFMIRDWINESGDGESKCQAS